MAEDDFQASPGSPRIYELIQDAPGKGKPNSVWAWPEVVDWLKVAGQPVPGPWPPHQEKRPDPSLVPGEAVAVAEPQQELSDIARKRGEGESAEEPPAEAGPTMARWGGRRGSERPDYGSAASSPGGYGKPVPDATDVVKAHMKAVGSKGIWQDTKSIWKGGSLKDLDPSKGE
jgi:hypothetical protein